MKFVKPTKDELKKEDEEMNKYYLNSSIDYNDKKVLTIGELKSIVTTIEILESLVNKLDDEDYHYICQWLLLKNYKEKNNK